MKKYTQPGSKNAALLPPAPDATLFQDLTFSQTEDGVTVRVNRSGLYGVRMGGGKLKMKRLEKGDQIVP